MPEIRNVSTGEMESTAKYVEGKINEWDACVANVYKELLPQLKDVFKGVSSENYSQLWLDDKPRFERLSGMMREYCDFIYTAANDYDSTDERIGSTIKA